MYYVFKSGAQRRFSLIEVNIYCLADKSNEIFDLEWFFD